MKKTMLFVVCGFVMSLSGFAQQNTSDQSIQDNQQATALRQELTVEINAMSVKELIQTQADIERYRHFKFAYRDPRQAMHENDQFYDTGKMMANNYCIAISSHQQQWAKDTYDGIMAYYKQLRGDGYEFEAAQLRKGVDDECNNHQIAFPW